MTNNPQTPDLTITHGSIQAFLSISENDEYNFQQKDVLKACTEAASGKILVMN